MQQSSASDDARVIETDQSEDTRVSVSFGPRVAARIVSLRSRESREQSLPDQDYAIAVCSAGGTSISLCVCDGVGSSYKGNFAAQYLASCLAAWLQQLPAIPQKSAKAIRPLRSRLHAWARDAQQTLIDFAIAPDIPELVREVLEELRLAHGSETVFFCGRIDLVQPARPLRSNHTHTAQGIFLWMGNVAAQLFTSEHTIIHLGETEDDAPRWSTARGQRGILAARVLVLERIDRLLVFTDGLRPISDRLAALNDDELDAEMQNLLSEPANDDMTLLDIHWAHPEPAPGKEEAC